MASALARSASLPIYGSANSPPPPPISTHGCRPDRGWDYVLVFPSDLPSLSKILRSLRSAHFAYAPLVDNSDRLFLRIALPDPFLASAAEETRLHLELLPPYGGGFIPYTAALAPHFVNSTRPARNLPYFHTADIVMLTRETLASRASSGAGLDIERMKMGGEVLGAYALQNRAERDACLAAAVTIPWHHYVGEKALVAMRRYLGARVALYLAFVSFYARFLRGVAALSVPVTAVLFLGRGNDVVVAAVRSFFGLAVVFWATYVLEFWKRRNAVLSVKWGMGNLRVEESSEVRPQYEGQVRSGFWCAGGFVDLQDLDAGREAHASGGEASGVTGMDADEAEVSVDVDVGGSGHDSEEGEDRVLIGGDDDEMFKLEAMPTGVTFPDLPEFPVCGPKETRYRRLLGAATTFIFAVIVGGFTFLVLYFRLEMIAALLEIPGLSLIAPLAPGVITGVLISVSDTIWRTFSVHLTRFENHRTNESYDNSLIRKRFAFQCVSNYSSLFYIAFVKPYRPFDACVLGFNGKAPDCMAELEAQLIGVVITKATIMQAVELGTPIFLSWFNAWVEQWRGGRQESEAGDEGREDSHLLDQTASHASADSHCSGSPEDEDDSRHLKESKLSPPYDPIDDYGELVIQYGYFCLFGVCWPLAALVQLVDVTVESRSDAFKVLKLSQLPNARDAASIGTWIQIMEFLRTASIVTNAALVVYTGRAVEKIAVYTDLVPAVSSAAVFLVVEHALFAVKWIIEASVNEIPGRTKRFLARQEFMIARWFEVGDKDHFRSKDD